LQERRAQPPDVQAAEVGAGERHGSYEGGLLTLEPRRKVRKKSDLPSKVCLRCGLPFTWRKKWERDWNDVKYCSDRCRRGSAATARQAAHHAAPEPTRR